MIKKKKLAIICSTDYEAYPLGGMMSFIVDSLPFLKESFEITLWGVSTTLNSPDYIVINDEKYPFRVFSRVKLKNKIIPNMLRVIFGINNMRKNIISEGYDFLYIHGIPLSFPFFNKNIKVINHVHGMTNPFAMTPNKFARNPLSIFLYEKYRSWIVKKSDLILLASDKVGHKQFSDRFPNNKTKIKYLPNFADTTIFRREYKEHVRNLLNIPSDTLLLVNTGRIGLQKDPILLINSYLDFYNNYDSTSKLVIIGDGELRNEVEKIIKNNNINENVIVTGKIDRNEINLWLNAADLYVYTSHANGFPISLAESAICGLPIVTTDVNGVHDLVVNNYSGFLIKKRLPSNISKAINKATKNKELFSENILKISEDFTPEKILKRLTSYINNL